MLLIPIGVLYSCETDNDLQAYSCDKTINKWVSDNIPLIRTMNRNDWNNVDEERKRATYRAFTQEGNIEITEYRNRSISSTESDCNCNASWHTYNNCYSGDCKHTEKGCGPMWTYNCNGIVVQTNK